MAEFLAFVTLLTPIFVIFLIIWPILVWSHLREQTALLKKQNELLEEIAKKSR
jgi:hypothetical protein